MEPDFPRSRSHAAAILGVAVLLVACSPAPPAGTATGSGVVSADASPTSTARSATASAVVSANPSPTSPARSAIPSGSTAGASLWTKVAVTDPSLGLEIPHGWQTLSVAATRDELERQLPTLSGDVAKGWKYEIGLLKDGHVRAIFAGPASIRPFTATIQVLILADAADLATAVDRQQKIDATLTPGGRRSRLDLVLPLGPAVRAIIISEPTGGSPSQGIEYFVRLDDGSILLLNGAAPADDHTFPDIMSHAAESMSQD